jgi:hypothetical protein
MKRSLSTMIVCILMIAICASSLAATIWTPCINFRWKPGGVTNRIIVDVYLDPQMAGYLNIPQNELNAAVEEATMLWNEQSGAALALRWNGPPAVGADISTLPIWITVTPAAVQCSGTLMITVGDTPNNIWKHAVIEIRKEYKLSKGGPCIPLPWKLYAEDSNPNPPGKDLVSALMHEFGHATGYVGNIHPAEDVSCPTTHPSYTSALTQQSIMDADGIFVAGRVLRAWDKHRAANLYQQREQYSSLLWRWFDNSASTWTGAQTAIAAPSHIQHRPAASQNASSVFFIWNERGGLNRRTLKSRWLGSFDKFEPLVTTGSANESPSAIAVNGTSQAIAVYQKPEANQYAANGDLLRIYYRLSTNGGISFGPEVSTNMLSRRYGIGAGFDPVSGRFIISYASDPYNLIQLVTMPSTGGPLVFNSYASTTGWEGATIACRPGVANGCRMIYRKTNSYDMRMLTANVNADGTITLASNTSVGFKSFGGQPSMVWSEFNQKFQLAFLGHFGAIYSYVMAPTGTTWTGVGDIVNEVDVLASTPTMASSTYFTYTFWVRWW